MKRDNLHFQPFMAKAMKEGLWWRMLSPAIMVSLLVHYCCHVFAAVWRRRRKLWNISVSFIDSRVSIREIIWKITTSLQIKHQHKILLKCLAKMLKNSYRNIIYEGLNASTSGRLFHSHYRNVFDIVIHTRLMLPPGWTDLGDPLKLWKARLQGQGTNVIIQSLSNRPLNKPIASPYCV